MHVFREVQILEFLAPVSFGVISRFGAGAILMDQHKQPGILGVGPVGPLGVIRILLDFGLGEADVIFNRAVLARNATSKLT